MLPLIAITLSSLTMSSFLFPSQLNVIVNQPHLLARLKGREANVRAAVAAERIAQRAVTAGTYFSLNGKVDFGQVVGIQLETFQCLVGFGSLGGVFGGEALCETAAAVLAGAAALPGLWLAFGGY
jgi:hypothetical protein